MRETSALCTFVFRVLLSDSSKAPSRPTGWPRSSSLSEEEEDEEEERSLIGKELIRQGLGGLACLPVIVVCSLSISAPGNYWLVLIGKPLISCSLALFN